MNFSKNPSRRIDSNDSTFVEIVELKTDKPPPLVERIISRRIISQFKRCSNRGNIAWADMKERLLSLLGQATWFSVWWNAIVPRGGQVNRLTKGYVISRWLHARRYTRDFLVTRLLSLDLSLDRVSDRCDLTVKSDRFSLFQISGITKGKRRKD